VQAHTRHDAALYHTAADGLVVSQWAPSEARWERAGVAVTVTQGIDAQAGSTQGLRTLGSPAHRPQSLAIELRVVAAEPVEFTLSLRLPWWLAGPAQVAVNGAPVAVPVGGTAFCRLPRQWHNDRVRVELPKALTTCPLPDRPDLVAFLDGPVVLAGLCDEERVLQGDPTCPQSLLTPDVEREWGRWLPGWRTVGQARGLRFIPLHDVVDEPYTVYFPVRDAGA